MTIFKKITAVFLAAVFIFSSLGFTISSMVCLKSGKGTMSLFAMEDCCAKKIPSSTVSCCDDEDEEPVQSIIYLIKGECCDISNYLITLNEYQASEKISVDQPVVIQSLFVFSPIVTNTAEEQRNILHASNLPPPLYGRTLLNFISTLTI
ncbi:MAG: hypothetical protein H0X46_07795 [Bacteroidetes bacterium]|nr:hypothetical protein [Bacteroidota bacterium]